MIFIQIKELQKVDSGTDSGFVNALFLTLHTCCTTCKDYIKSLQWGLCLVWSFAEKVFKEKSQVSYFALPSLVDKDEIKFSVISQKWWEPKINFTL